MEEVLNTDDVLAIEKELAPIISRTSEGGMRLQIGNVKFDFVKDLSSPEVVEEMYTTFTAVLFVMQEVFNEELKRYFDAERSNFN